MIASRAERHNFIADFEAAFLAARTQSCDDPREVMARYMGDIIAFGVLVNGPVKLGLDDRSVSESQCLHNWLTQMSPTAWTLMRT
jgi:hypothetical protein